MEPLAPDHTAGAQAPPDTVILTVLAGRRCPSQRCWSISPPTWEPEAGGRQRDDRSTEEAACTLGSVSRCVHSAGHRKAKAAEPRRLAGAGSPARHMLTRQVLFKRLVRGGGVGVERKDSLPPLHNYPIPRRVPRPR